MSPAPTAPSRAIAIAAGDTVGRYIVRDRVGEGAMGVVVSAFDPELDRRVALKVLNVSAGERDRLRLLREAQALARLSHPNVIVIHDVGTWTDPEGARHVFLAMELVEGGTLARWLQSGSRSASEILAAFLEAGQGLAAAHAAGLVHRDFKPDNVLIGGEPRRVRVTDFGLARDFTDASAPKLDSLVSGEPVPSLDETLTRTGALAGTPAYMAPEQLEGRAADPRADQFAFCVALFEALTGKRPFEGTSPIAIHEAIVAGAVEVPSALPRAIRRAIMRGLAFDPDARHRSMEELLAALRPRRVRWRWVVASLVPLVAAGALAWPRGSAAGWCDAVPERLDGVWDPARRAAIERQLGDIAPAFAREAWPLIATDLDARKSQWIEAQSEACAIEADAPAIAARRMACLHRRLEGMRSYTDLLLEADAGIVEHAVDGLEGIGWPRTCAELGAPLTLAAAETDETRLAIGAELARIDVLGDLGRYDDAVAAAERTRERAIVIGDRWLEAEAVYSYGRALEDAGRPDQAEQAYHDAFSVAVAARHEEVVARAAMSVAVLVAQSERADDARQWIEHATAAVERMGEGADPMAPHLENARGRVAHLRGDFEEARAAFQHALELRTEMEGADHPALASYLVNLGHSLAELGELQASADAMQRALTLEERAYGASHPRLASTLTALCSTLSVLDRTDEAIADCTRAREILAQTLGQNHPHMGTTLTNLGNAYGRAGRFRDALEAYTAALHNAEAVYGPHDMHTGLVHNNLGVVHELDGDYEAALVEHRAALEIFERSLGEQHPRTSVVRMNMASVLSKLGRWADAEAPLRTAIDALQTRRGPDHPDVALALGMLAETFLKRDRPADAIPLLERGRQVLANSEGNARQAAQTDFALGAALHQSGRDKTRGIALVRSAREAFVALGEGGADKVPECDTWLHEHAGEK